MADYLYAGAFNPGGEGGYSVFSWDEACGYARLSCTCLSEISVGMHAYDPVRNILYLTDERTKNPDFPSGGGGRVFAAEIDPGTGSLKELGRCPSYGAAASFCVINCETDYLVVTNFGGHSADDCVTGVEKDADGKWQVKVRHDLASTALLRLAQDGTFDGASDVFLHEETVKDGLAVLPHAHSVSMSPDGSFFAVCDMGTDKIHIFTIDRDKGRLAPACEPYECRKGSGPRYSAFHPEKPFFFVNFEEKPYVASFQTLPDGSLREITNLELLTEDDVLPGNKESGMILSPDGRFLYICMRGINTIEVISVDQETGRLKAIQRMKTSGERLKDCALSPDGRYLAVAARGSSTVELFSVSSDGTLKARQGSISVKNAGHVFFIRM